MKKSIFNTDYQQENITSKIVVGLERLSEVFKVLLWEQAKILGLSPIQIQLLIFIAYHHQSYATVSNLAKEFNITKATISDAIRVLEQKSLISKTTSTLDNRSYSILLTPQGKKIVTATENFTAPIEDQLKDVDQKDLNTIYTTLNKLIYKLNRKGILSVQRICYGCKFYVKSKNKSFCNYLQKELEDKEIRLDCPEFEGKT